MSQTVLGFDYGRRKLGIAFGQTSTGFAEGITTIPANSPAKRRRIAWRPLRFARA